MSTPGAQVVNCVARVVLPVILLVPTKAFVAYGQAQPSDSACKGIEVSQLVPAGRAGPTQWRLYVRGAGARARYHAFGVLSRDPHSTDAEQAMLRALDINPANRIGDSYSTMQDAETAAHEHCRAMQSAL